MNTVSARASNRSTIVLVVYCALVLGLVGWFLGSGTFAVSTRGDWNDALMFGAIGLAGVVAVQLGASVPITLSVGTWGAFVSLTAGQDNLVRYLAFGAVLFAIGMYGMVASRNAVRVLMSIELMLNAVNINFVAFARYVDPANIKGQIFAIFILTVAAAEAAVGLAIVLACYRNMATVDMDRFNLLKW